MLFRLFKLNKKTHPFIDAINKDTKEFQTITREIKHTAEVLRNWEKNKTYRYKLLNNIIVSLQEFNELLNEYKLNKNFNETFLNVEKQKEEAFNKVWKNYNYLINLCNYSEENKNFFNNGYFLWLYKELVSRFWNYLNNVDFIIQNEDIKGV